MEQVDLWLQKSWVGLCCRLGGSRAHRSWESPGRSLQRALQLPIHPAPCNPCRKLPPGRKTALSVQPSPQLEKNPSFLRAEKQEDSSAAQPLFLIFRKTARPWFPVAFALCSQPDAHQLPFFPSHPSPFLAFGLCFRADSLGASWRSLGPISSSQQAAVTRTRTFLQRSPRAAWELCCL